MNKLQGYSRQRPIEQCGRIEAEELTLKKTNMPATSIVTYVGTIHFYIL